MTQAILLIVAATKEEQVDKIREVAHEFEVILEENFDEADASRVEVIYGWNRKRFSEELIEKMTNLRWVQAVSAGIDYIPEMVRNNENIFITNVSGIHAVPIAETVFGYILSQIRGLFVSYENQKERLWQSPNHQNLSSLTDKTLLIYGAGKIGSELARIGKAFNMNTVGVNTSGEARKYFDKMYQLTDSFSAIKDADIIINSLPATDLTNDIFDQAFFEEMKNSAYFINIGRGQAVDEEALHQVLVNNEIAGAYLDVFKTEPLPVESNLWTTNRLHITSHYSGIVEHYREAIYPIFEENLLAYIKDKQPTRNIVSVEKGY